MPRRSRYDDYDDYYVGAAPRDHIVEPPGRRHISERRHRHRSPEVIPPIDEAYAPRRKHHHSHREPVEPVVLSKPAAGHRAKSPLPYYTSEPLPRESRREGRHEPRHPRHERDGPRDYHDRGYQPDPRDKPRRSHRDDVEYYPRRERTSPPPESHRYPGRNGHAHHSPRPRYASPEPRRARDYPAPAYPGEEDRPRRRPRSQERSYNRAVSPHRGRDRDVDVSRSSRPSDPRRKSAPAPSAAKKKQQWWQNPLIQAGARTAFSAGAQAAMQNRHNNDPWLGSKGAKVASAALGAALMDGMGQRK